MEERLVLIRGGGDLASGAIYRLHRAGLPVVVAELERPLAVRRAVAFAEAVFAGCISIEGITARRVADRAQALAAIARREVPVAVDPGGALLRAMSPQVVVDARLAKARLDTRLDDARLVVALGPGFEAGMDCHAVIETMRGHTLGRVIWQGSALPDTGEPERIGGKGRSRVLRAPAAGRVIAHKHIGDAVVESELIADLEPADGSAPAPITAPFDGVLRGLIHPDVEVAAGTKIGDVDPRGRPEHCFTISDKALAVGGGVVEAVLAGSQRTGK